MVSLYFTFWFQTIGFEKIGRGKEASTIPEMLSVKSISFDFKVQALEKNYRKFKVSLRYTLPTTADAASSLL